MANFKSFDRNAFKKKGMGMNDFTKEKVLLAIGILAVIAVLVGLRFSYVIVKPGTVGVKMVFGEVQQDVLEEGLHLIMPIMTRVILINIRIQKIEAEASASSKDLQVVTSRVALNFNLSAKKAHEIYQKIGLGYQETVIQPAIQESVKSTTSKFTAEELITRRTDVKNKVYDEILKRLEIYNIKVREFSIIDFNFSREFNNAIESKQVAEQAALRAKNDLQRIKTEAEQVRAKAEGEAQAKLEIARAEAESQRLQRETLTENLIQLRAIEKWNGVLPTMMTGEGSSAFIDVTSILKDKKRK